MRKAELLAPAGSFEALKAAVHNGADAVYLGGKNFSARAFADNFDRDEMKQAVEYAHLRNVRIYVTVNTLLNDDELENAVSLCDHYYEIGVDGLIIQDLGLYYRLKERHPDMELHGSTQMHVHNLSGVRMARKLGYTRVVVARESSLEFIKEACKEDIEIECFVHGAICVSYSGQCLLSSVTKDRSANRGMCAQCCRLRYEAFDESEGKKIDTDTEYLLSPKDMFLLKDIPDLIEAGVASFKIEGRMKSPAYVAYVTSLYRKEIDAYYNKQPFTLTKEEEKNLKVLFNRGFTDTYLKDSSSDLFGQIRPNHLGIEIGKVLRYQNGKALIELNAPLRQFDGIRVLTAKGETGTIVNLLYKDSLLVSEAGKGDLVEVDLPDKVYKYNVVYKTLDHELQDSLSVYPEKRIPITLSLSLYPDKKPAVRAEYDGGSFTYESDILPSEALKRPLDEENIIAHFCRFNDSVYEVKDITVKCGNVFLPVSKLNELRRSFIDALDRHRLSSYRRTPVYSEVAYCTPCEDEETAIVESPWTLPGVFNIPLSSPINPENRAGEVITEFGGLLNADEGKTAYYTLNAANSYAYEFLQKLGLKRVILSTEMNDISIKRMRKAYEKRNGRTIHPYVLVYGRRPLMYLKRDPLASYRKKGHTYTIKDATVSLEVIENEGITELIETVPVLKNCPEGCRPLVILRDESDKRKYGKF